MKRQDAAAVFELKHRGGLGLVEVEIDVALIGAKEDVALLAEGRDAFEVGEVYARGGRVMGIIDPHDRGLRNILFRKGPGFEAIACLRAKFDGERLTAGEEGAALVDGIGGEAIEDTSPRPVGI